MLPNDRYDGEFYPGSKTPVKDYTRERYGPLPDPDLLGPPAFTSDGTEFWLIGDLALLLDRSPVTLRRWEAKGDLPATPYRLSGATVHAEARVYTRPMIEGLVKIAYEEGLLAHRQRKLSVTRFRERARTLFEEVT